ncbi:hypothetical protein ACFQGT_03615 [Natrialbaceae archaeon GCM10025810]|uniref:hypothetical protein n=1 Tax=Halovalidus salilacus TaxID=3075124 RepID=UPI0036187806
MSTDRERTRVGAQVRTRGANAVGPARRADRGINTVYSALLLTGCAVLLSFFMAGVLFLF